MTKQILGQNVFWYYPEYALTNDVLGHLHLTLLIKYITQTICIWHIRVLAHRLTADLVQAMLHCTAQKLMQNTGNINCSVCLCLVWASDTRM